jgi:hypothetical protein
LAVPDNIYKWISFFRCRETLAYPWWRSLTARRLPRINLLIVPHRARQCLGLVSAKACIGAMIPVPTWTRGAGGARNERPRKIANSGAASIIEAILGRS